MLLLSCFHTTQIIPSTLSEPDKHRFVMCKCSFAKLCSLVTGKKWSHKTKIELPSDFPLCWNAIKKKINFLKLCAAHRFPPASNFPAYLPRFFSFFIILHKDARTYSDTWKHASSLLMISHPRYERPAVPMVMASLIVCTADTHIDTDPVEQTCRRTDVLLSHQKNRL